MLRRILFSSRVIFYVTVKENNNMISVYIPTNKKHKD